MRSTVLNGRNQFVVRKVTPFKYLGAGRTLLAQKGMNFSSFYPGGLKIIFSALGVAIQTEKNSSFAQKMHFPCVKTTCLGHPNSNQGVICQLLLKNSTTFLGLYTKYPLLALTLIQWKNIIVLTK